MITKQKKILTGGNGRVMIWANKGMAQENGDAMR